MQQLEHFDSSFEDCLIYVLEQYFMAGPLSIAPVEKFLHSLEKNL